MATADSKLHVLYEDNHVIAVFKPAGMLTQGDRSGDASLMDLTKAWIKRTKNKPGDVFLGLVHRLDRPVAGVVVFGRTSKGAARLSEQFRTRTVTKVYHALVAGHVEPASGRLEHYLWQPSESSPVRVSTTPGAEAKPAALNYKVLRSTGNDSLLEVILETGRKHQIRAQLAAIGHPILGDRKYGSTRDWHQPGTIALVGKRLEFFHPVRREEGVIVVVPPHLDPMERDLR